MRVQKALYWYWTRDLTQEEIGEKLGVSRQKVNEYISEAPTSPVVEAKMNDLETEVRYVAAEQLREQLRVAGERAQTAEKPVKIWQDDDGELVVQEERNDRGDIVNRYPVPQGFEMGPDEKGRFYGRNEVREIVDLLTDIVGAKAAERHELEHSGELTQEHTLTVDDSEADLLREFLHERRHQGTTDGNDE